MDHTCRLLIALKLRVGRHHAKICKDLGIRRSLVFKSKKLLDEGRDLMPWSRGRKKQWVGTDAAIAEVQTAVAEIPQQSMRQLARQHSIDPTAMWDLVKEDLDMENCVVQSCAGLWAMSLIKSEFFLTKKSTQGRWQSITPTAAT
jgi:transposase-like protein